MGVMDDLATDAGGRAFQEVQMLTMICLSTKSKGSGKTQNQRDASRKENWKHFTGPFVSAW